MQDNKMQEEEFAELKISDRLFKLPIKRASIGPNIIDVSNIYSQTGYFTYDPGFMSTASCQSTITYIDGDQGILRYRGYDVKSLAEKSTFLEVAYLLLNGELPNIQQYQSFTKEVTNHSLLNEELKNLFRAFHHSAHPMAIMLSVTGSLAAFYPNFLDIASERELFAIRMIAKISTIAAMTYKYLIGQPFIYPNNSLDFTENFLNMMFATPCEEYKVNPIIKNALDKIFILHADHEQNASTATVRLAGSSGANPFACISTGIASLWGPAHGGANEAVINMLKDIGKPENISKFIAKVKDKQYHTKLMGFGHRVYKNYDPRAEVLKKLCKQVLESLGQLDNNPLLQIAAELETIALNDQYFVERKLYPNVDFYSGIIYQAMNIPSQMFTVLFAIARTVGWMAQWKEMHESENQKISRPRQLYTGYTQREFVSLDKRINKE